MHCGTKLQSFANPSPFACVRKWFHAISCPFNKVSWEIPSSRAGIPGRNFPGGKFPGNSREIPSREIPVAREFPGAREFPVAREFPGAREFPVAREIPVVREIPGNSRTGNSREGNFPGLTGGRVREFPVEHHWTPGLHGNRPLDQAASTKGSLPPGLKCYVHLARGMRLVSNVR